MHSNESEEGEYYKGTTQPNAVRKAEDKCHGTPERT